MIGISLSSPVPLLCCPPVGVSDKVGVNRLSSLVISRAYHMHEVSAGDDGIIFRWSSDNAKHCSVKGILRLQRRSRRAALAKNVVELEGDIAKR